MSAVGDALAALKNAVLLQERLDVVRRELSSLSDNVRRLDDRVIDLKERIVKIETLIELTRGGGGVGPQPKLS
ncbi:hypothetical protein [Sphingomonas oligophenolica]|uniref:Uncharacterized protein n=1 Tax=Sphingomonas oligophenolica TaxID=301154 RepID=A0A502CFY7_9SPHN|nr:hypothetical protein [Sphingomonas oligophenolica]TPG10939.1 hypothetical protein EAH84_11715 [Sphingomonas oligophenolica]